MRQIKSKTKHEFFTRLIEAVCGFGIVHTLAEKMETFFVFFTLDDPVISVLFLM